MSETVTHYFFDTSALVKRYHDEVGTAAVDEAFDDEGAFCLISDLTVIECHSAFAKKVRTQEIGEEDYQVTMQRLMQDVDRDLLRLRTLGEHEKRQAVSFLRSYGMSHGLRTLDALQCAVLQNVERPLDGVYCADRRLNSVLDAEGLAVLNPEELVQ